MIGIPQNLKLFNAFFVSLSNDARRVRCLFRRTKKTEEELNCTVRVLRKFSRNCRNAVYSPERNNAESPAEGFYTQIYRWPFTYAYFYIGHPGESSGAELVVGPAWSLGLTNVGALCPRVGKVHL
jgi:hypothetical protein